MATYCIGATVQLLHVHWIDLIQISSVLIESVSNFDLVWCHGNMLLMIPVILLTRASIYIGSMCHAFVWQIHAWTAYILICCWNECLAVALLTVVLRDTRLPNVSQQDPIVSKNKPIPFFSKLDCIKIASHLIC